jgi:AcrR family transcriptional regulator
MARTRGKVGRPRKDERPPDHPGTDRLILDAASELFARASYERTTIAGIAERAGVAHGTVYAHFDSKAELFVAVMRRALRRLEAGWRAEAPGPEMLVTMVDRFLAPEAAELRSLVIEHYHAAAHDEDVKRLLTAFNDRSRADLAAHVERWRADGAITASGAADAIAQQIVAQLVGLCAIEKIRPDLATDGEWRKVLHRQIAALVGMPAPS